MVALETRRSLQVLMAALMILLSDKIVNTKFSFRMIKNKVFLDDSQDKFSKLTVLLFYNHIVQ